MKHTITPTLCMRGRRDALALRHNVASQAGVLLQPAPAECVVVVVVTKLVNAINCEVLSSNFLPHQHQDIPSLFVKSAVVVLLGEDESDLDSVQLFNSPGGILNRRHNIFVKKFI